MGGYPLVGTLNYTHTTGYPIVGILNYTHTNGLPKITKIANTKILPEILALEQGGVGLNDDLLFDLLERAQTENFKTRYSKQKSHWSEKSKKSKRTLFFEKSHSFRVSEYRKQNYLTICLPIPR